MYDEDLCRCKCHDFPDGVMSHCIACCYVCKYCGQNIKNYCFQRHEEECNDKRRNQNNRKSTQL